MKWLTIVSAFLLAAVSFADESIYSDSLNSGWAKWDFGATINFSSTSYVHSGTYSISVTETASNQALYLATNNANRPMDLKLSSFGSMGEPWGPATAGPGHSQQQRR